MKDEKIEREDNFLFQLFFLFWRIFLFILRGIGLFLLLILLVFLFLGNSLYRIVFLKHKLY